ncbi:hypothetical protein NPIL_630711 [Nephila pilipes]|uniref:Uncharacterized protein n=1 Tax=Nephila pilipes TaxID=299642 RepID=A0A8X6NPP2_NEPPI|nr:hypothetical protein NPIL_630711 [Nephila pilipes]
MAEALRENHCRPETFYVVYRYARSKTAEVRKRRSPPRTTSIAGPKSFTNLPPIRNRKPPKFVRPETLREPRSSKLKKSYEGYRNARSKAADVSDGRNPPRTNIIGAPKRFGKSSPKRDWKPPKFQMAAAVREPRSSLTLNVL